MTQPVTLELLPLGKRLTVESGTPLQDVLFAEGVEFPCGGRGKCKGCRIKLLDGHLPITPEDRQLLSEADLAAGWRLSCRAQATGHLKLELAQWEAAILSDDTAFAFTPREGLGVAVDLGTTTLVAQLLDLRTADVLGVRTALNAQAQHGADIMSRIQFAVADKGQLRLQSLIREQIGGMIQELLSASSHRAGELRQIVIVGNTVMHHLFCGVSVQPLSHHPFHPDNDGLIVMRAPDLGWNFGEVTVRFLPCLGGFVGSDILAGVLATGLAESEDLVALVDLGTNGEIVLGTRERMVCASTAAGPAFEGARIAMGMRAATGAISAVSLEDGELRCQVLGHGTPRGLCGSGLVDAVAVGLTLGKIFYTGRYLDGDALPLMAPVVLTQADIRQLQLAKGAIAAGIRMLAEECGAGVADIRRIYLAGAFGNYINRQSARRIGLLPFGPERVVASGNTALLGAKLALFNLRDGEGHYAELRHKIRHVALNEDLRFEEIFVDELVFPD